ncbi:MAG TPA: Nif3-like dinuclear metal center hexameric protein [Bacteroidales bacterium]|nr:Nif3-like dinuclear metal center hexameric protein [Bacteroidales bacterium]
MKIQDLLLAIELEVPNSLQEPFDNCGLQIGSPLKDVKKGLVCIDVTPQVINEAEKKGCDLIISHHPVLFKGLKKICGQNAVERVVADAIKKEIAIISLHTNLDNIHHGVNEKLGEVLGLKNLKILQPQKGLLRKLVTFCPGSHATQIREALFEAGAGQIGEYDSCSFNLEGTGTFRAGKSANPFVGKPEEMHYEPEVRIETIVPSYRLPVVLEAMFKSHPYEEVAYDIYPLENNFNQAGSGMIGEFDVPLPEIDFLDHIKKQLKIPCLRHTGLLDIDIKKVAFCGGSGAFLLEKAVEKGAQAFITGDIKFHQFFEAEGRILLIDAGHYETEQVTKELLYEIVNKKFSKFALLISEVNTNPVNYF